MNFLRCITSSRITKSAWFAREKRCRLDEKSAVYDPLALRHIKSEFTLSDWIPIDGSASLQHSFRHDRGVQTFRRQYCALLCVRSDGLRLRPHRELPYIHCGRSAETLPATKRLQADARNEHHGCGRQDHPQRIATRRLDFRLHENVYAGLLGRHAHAVDTDS